MNSCQSTEILKKHLQSDELFKHTKSRFFEDLRKHSKNNKTNVYVKSKFDDFNLSISSISKFVPNSYSTPKKKKTSNRSHETTMKNNNDINNGKGLAYSKVFERKLNYSKNENNTSLLSNLEELNIINKSFLSNHNDTLSISQKVKQIVEVLEIEEVSNRTFNSEKSFKSQEYSCNKISPFKSEIPVIDSELLKKQDQNSFVYDEDVLIGEQMVTKIVDKSIQTRRYVDDKSTQTSLSFEEISTEDETEVSCKSSKLLIRKNQLPSFIKRLIIGISLYGCDFQKISTTLWSSNEQPSAKVLYKIYRQCIVKA
ncbi:uncharacterized protein LOC143916980 [Arctopsyche grandis]|uniref:uncharacterized protein LOC143916980 n=1 Tax=Arctopsyche grandis TaxID=121162 RepID=UPI00406D8F99